MGGGGTVQNTNEVVGIIRRPGFGNRDVGRPVLWFDVYITELTAALQVFDIEQAVEIIRDSGVRDVKDLEGKACWVISDGGILRFKRVWKP